MESLLLFPLSFWQYPVLSVFSATHFGEPSLLAHNRPSLSPLTDKMFGRNSVPSLLFEHLCCSLKWKILQCYMCSCTDMPVGVSVHQQTRVFHAFHHRVCKIKWPFSWIIKYSGLFWLYQEWEEEPTLTTFFETGTSICVAVLVKAEPE